MNKFADYITTRMHKIFKRVLVLSLFVHGFPGMAQTRFLGFHMEGDRTRVTIPFEVLANLIVIELTLNDQLPLKFVLDTGVRTPILTDKYLSDIVRVSYDREVEIYSAGAQGKAVAYIANDVSLSIPGIRADDQDIYVLKEDFLGLTEVLGERVHGLIGFDFFKNFVVKIDYRDKEITFYEPESYRGSRFNETYPITIEDAKAYLQAEITLSDGTKRPVKLLVDTGASHALWLDPPQDSTDSVLPDVVFATPVGRALSGEIQGHLGRTPTLTLQKSEFTEVLTSFPDRNEFLDVVKSTGRDGSLGSEIFRRFEVTFDYPNKSLYF
ncbi:MAG: retropepsin-like aspartic protease, partial [Bacteroidota bacterium]